MTDFEKRKLAKAGEMYDVLNDFRRVYFVKGGHPDEIAEVATRALRIVRQIDNDLDEKGFPAVRGKK
jgi:hypothetical protein